MSDHPNLEIFRTEDGTVTKFIHSDGSETAIKAVPSQSTFIDKETGTVDIRLTDRNKYSIFISSSTGCYKEWDSIIGQLGQRLKNHKKIKIQTSAGSEVQAACGQFLVTRPRPIKIVK